MSTKVGLISDVHATPEPLAEALEIFHRAEVDTILCAGDIAGYGKQLEPTVALLQKHNCQTIMGNHDLWWLERDDNIKSTLAEPYLRSLPPFFELSLAGKELYMVHASPPDSLMDGIKLRDADGRLLPEQIEFWSDSLKHFPFDVLVVGHTHQVFAEQLGNTLVINPGSTRYNHTCMILTLPEMEVEIHPLGGNEPSLVWNWGMEALLQMQGKKA